jgi:hypothetical protein
MKALFKNSTYSFIIRNTTVRTFSSGPLKDKETAEERFYFDKEESK